jgi:hypothetical protein
MTFIDSNKTIRDFRVLDSTQTSIYDTANLYIVQGTPIKKHLFCFCAYDSAQYYKKIRIQGEYNLYFLGDFKYVNLITQQHKRYRFIIKLPLETNAIGDFIYNENSIDNDYLEHSDTLKSFRKKLNLGEKLQVTIK